MKRNNLLRLTALLLAPLAARLATADSKPAALSSAVETDARVQADGKGWRLDQAKITDTTRPRVLLIGDSILNGYLGAVKTALKGKAYVDAWVNPYCQSENYNRILANVLTNGPYDVVHFNMGLHGWQKDRIKDGTFEPLTKAYVEVIRAKLPKAKIIWASSTPVTVKNKPTELDQEINSIIVEHNRMAAKVMGEMNVPVNDFYALLVGKLGLARGDQFHWKNEAYVILAQCATDSILRELGVAAQPKSEPTNAKEAADKKNAGAAAVEAKYAALVAALPPEEQAWERTLQENLGGFYLPLYKDGRVKGSAQAWDYVKDVPGLPRVLLIGDSVSRGYTLAARKALAGKANVHRAPENCGPTANGLKKIDVWLGDGKWDVIHFNFGIHDRATPAADYQHRLETLIARMKATGAKLIWASTTPVPPDTKDGPKVTEQIIEKNRIAAEVMAKHGIAIDDLFTFITPHLAKAQNPKDVHFNNDGYDLLGKQAATVIEQALSKKSE